MQIFDKYADFVKEQILLQEKLTKKFAEVGWRKALHMQAAEKYRTLLRDLEAAQKILDSEDRRSAKYRDAPQQLALSLEDLEDLPQELLAELSVSDADKLEFAIVKIIEQAGGILTLDKILIELYRSTGEVHKRNTITSRLYRMAQKGLIYPVPTRKGVYAVSDLSEEEAAKRSGGAPAAAIAIEQVD